MGERLGAVSTKAPKFYFNNIFKPKTTSNESPRQNLIKYKALENYLNQISEFVQSQLKYLVNIVILNLMFNKNVVFIN